MDEKELLLSTCEFNKPVDIHLWDWKTTNSIFYYKNGGSVGDKLIAQLGNDYFIGGNKKEPKLYLWQINRHDPVKKLRMILPEVPSCLAVCPHSYYLAIGIKKDLYIWQLSSGKLLTVQRRNYQSITVIKFSSCGQFLVVGGQDGIINTYRFVDLVCMNKNYHAQSIIGQTQPLYTKNHHNKPIMDIYIGNFSRKSRFATCSIDQSVKLYELYTGKLLLNLILQNQIFSIIFDSPGWNIYMGCSRGVLQTFHFCHSPRKIDHHLLSEEISKNSLVFKGHVKAVKCLCLNTSGDILASGDDDGLILIWDVSRRQVLKKIKQTSSITNLKFILNHMNILNQEMRVTTSIKDLEMQLNLNDSNFAVSIIQTVDIEDPTEECIEEQMAIKKKLEEENVYLRATNQHLYEFSLDILHKNRVK